jgi:hypothetical protein
MYNTLAQIYNTNVLEKTAADMLAEQTGMDVANLSPDQLEAYAQQMLAEADQAAEVETQYADQAQLAQGANLADVRQTPLNTMPPEQLVQTPQFDEGDTVGKVAAYRIYHDLFPQLSLDIYETTKQASKIAFQEVLKEAGFIDKAKKVSAGARSLASATGSRVADAGKAEGRGVKNTAKGFGQHVLGGRRIGTTDGESRVGNTLIGAAHKETRGDWLKSQASRAALGAGAAGAGAAGYHAATKEANFVQPMQQQEQPQTSALEQIAQQKAMSYLQAQGYDINQLLGGQDEQVEQEQQQLAPEMQAKLANDMIRGQVDQYTDQLAMQMLSQLGIDLNSQTDPNTQEQVVQ